jgi:hypothetical protein
MQIMAEKQAVGRSSLGKSGDDDQPKQLVEQSLPIKYLGRPAAGQVNDRRLLNAKTGAQQIDKMPSRRR